MERRIKRLLSKQQKKKKRTCYYIAPTQLRYHSSLWEWILARRDFQKAMSYGGFYVVEKSKVVSEFMEWKRKFHGYSNNNARGYVDKKVENCSLAGLAERMSQTPDSLDEHDLFLVNAGRTSAIIFDSHKFLPPYLSLNRYLNLTKDLPVRFGPNHRCSPHILTAFRRQWNEITFIKALHYCGAFSALTKKLCGVEQYCSGPSGTLPSKFPFWMRAKPRNGKERMIALVHDGMVDLDECIYPLNESGGEIVMPIEAKVNHVYDLGWHKLAFPSYRFVLQMGSNVFFYRTGTGGSRSEIIHDDCDQDNEDQKSYRTFSHNPHKMKRRIIPVYCAADPYRRSAFIYVFRDLRVRAGPIGYGVTRARGFVLNDPKQLAPKSVYKVNLSWIYGEK